MENEEFFFSENFNDFDNVQVNDFDDVQVTIQIGAQSYLDR